MGMEEKQKELPEELKSLAIHLNNIYSDADITLKKRVTGYDLDKTIAKYMNNKAGNWPRIHTLLQISQCFYVSSDYLLGLTENVEEVTYKNAFLHLMRLVDEGLIIEHEAMYADYEEKDDSKIAPDFFIPGFTIAESNLASLCVDYVCLSEHIGEKRRYLLETWIDLVCSENEIDKTSERSVESELLKKQIASNLKKLMLEKDINQKRILDDLSEEGYMVAQSSLSKYIKGDVLPSVQFLSSICKRYNCSLDFLMGNDAAYRFSKVFRLLTKCIDAKCLEHLFCKIPNIDSFGYGETKCEQWLVFMDPIIKLFLEEYFSIYEPLDALRSAGVINEGSQEPLRWAENNYSAFNYPFLEGDNLTIFWELVERQDIKDSSLTDKREKYNQILKAIYSMSEDKKKEILDNHNRNLESDLPFDEFD